MAGKIILHYHAKIYTFGSNSVAMAMLCKMQAQINANGGKIKASGVDREYEKGDVVFINFEISRDKIGLIDEEKVDGWSKDAFMELFMTKDDRRDTLASAFDVARTRVREMFGTHRRAMVNGGGVEPKFPSIGGVAP
jgi:hypothetical protein